MPGETVFLLGVAVGIVVLAIAFGVYEFMQEQRREEEKAEAARKRRRLKRKLQQTEVARFQAEESVVTAQAGQADAQRQLLVANQFAERARIDFAGGGSSLKEIDEFLREGQILFQRLGRFLTVRVFVVPPTGRVCLEWIANWDRAYAPKVRIVVRGESTDTEEAYRGCWIRTMERGRLYAFDLDVFDGTQWIEHMDVSVQVPSTEQWERVVEGSNKLLTDESEQGQQELLKYRKMFDRFLDGSISRFQLKQQAEEKLQRSGLSSEEQRLIQAKVESWIASEEGQ